MIYSASLWHLPHELTVFANGVLIASTNEILPEQIALPAARRRLMKDFTAENEAARAARKAAAATLSAGSGKRLRSLQEELHALADAKAQLADLLALVSQGHHYHVQGCLGLLRALIARGGKNFSPLLQRVAGRLDLPLIVFAPIEADVPGELPFEEYCFEVTATDHGEGTAIDLDVWLDSPGVLFEGKQLTQNKLLRSITGATASHFDPYADPRQDTLEAMTLYVSNRPISMTCAYALKLAECVVQLCERVLNTR